MMFGIGGKKDDAEIVIKADGKTIKCYEKTVNLRKELIANGLDVYPLKAKITGSCGGNGTDTYISIFSYMIHKCIWGCGNDFFMTSPSSLFDIIYQIVMDDCGICNHAYSTLNIV